LKTYKVKQPYKKVTDDGLWKMELKPGDLIAWNEYLDGYTFAYYVYRWAVISQKEVEDNVGVFEVLE